MILLHLRESNFLAWMNFRIFTCQRFTDWYEYTCGFISIDVVVVGWHEIRCEKRNESERWGPVLQSFTSKQFTTKRFSTYNKVLTSYLCFPHWMFVVGLLIVFFCNQSFRLQMWNDLLTSCQGSSRENRCASHNRRQLPYETCTHV
jgi:hypothetical protein